jgi:AsmA protein
LKPILKKILKRLSVGILILGLLGVLLGVIFYGDIKQWIVGEVKDYLTEMEYGDLEIGEMDLSVFQHFPNMTVKINQIRFYEKKDSLRSPDEPPILSSEQLNLTLNSWELIRRKNLIVTLLSIENGNLDVLTYEDNKTNLERAFNPPKKQSEQLKPKDTTGQKKSKPIPPKSDKDVKKPEDGQPLLSVRLEEIRLKNISLKYNNPSENYSSQIELEEFRGKLILNNQGISCDLKTNFEIVKSAQLPTIAKQGPMSLSLDLDFNDATHQIKIHEGNLNFKNLNAALSGSYDHKNGNYVDMAFDASSNNLSFLSKLLQEDILKENGPLVNKAKIILHGKIKGKMEDELPNVDVNFGVYDLNIVLPKGKGKFNNLGFKGELHTGESDDFSNARLSIRDLQGEMPGGFVTGNLDVRNFKNPYVKSNMELSLILDGYDDIFHLPNIDSLSGKIDFISEMDGLLNLENQHEMDSIGSWSLTLEDIGFRHIPSNKFISKLKGTITESQNQVEISDLGMYYDSSSVNINAQINNLYHFIFNKEQDLLAELELTSDQLFTDHFITDPEKDAAVKDRMSNLNLSAIITMRDNDIFDSYFPKINAVISNLSFDLDKLPGISKAGGTFEMFETENGFNININNLDGVLPLGEGIVSANVLIPPDFKTLNIINTDLDIKNIPQEYVIELLNEMKDRELIGAKNMKLEEMTIINGKLGISAVLELVPFALQKARISNADISMKQPDASNYEVRNFNLDLDGLYFNHQPGSYKIAGVKFAKGELHVDAINTSSISDVPVDIGFNAENDKINIRFSTLRDTIMLDRGSLFFDMSKSPLELELNYALENIDMASVISDYTSEKLIEGTINASMEFKGTGENMNDLKSSLTGDIKIRGDSLTLYGVDLDDILRKYERSQKFNLADVSAFIIAGPMGAAVTKGADFTSLIGADFKPEHTTNVSMAIADWKIDKGILSTKDVAFSTSANRVAFEGSLDFTNDSIPKFTVFVVDKKGCSLMEQNIYGKFDDIKMGKLKIAKTLLGSVINLVNSVVGAKCEAVYNGVIQHPTSSK